MDDSPFAKLSPEIRNRIYEFAYTNEYPIEFFILADGAFKPSVVPRKHPLGLAYTCGTIYRESTQLFYATNKFTIHGVSAKDAIESLKRFCLAVGQVNAEALRSVTLNLGSWFVADHRDPNIRHGAFDLKWLLCYRFSHQGRYPNCEYQVKITFQCDAMEHLSQLCLSGTALENDWKAALDPIEDEMVYAMQMNQDSRVALTLLQELQHCRDDVRATTMLIERVGAGLEK